MRPRAAILGERGAEPIDKRPALEASSVRRAAPKLGATALDSAYLGAKALQKQCKLSSMQSHLTHHMRVFVAGEVSVQSLSYAAQSERVDQETAQKVIAVLAGWEGSRASMSQLRERVQNLL